MNHEQRRVRRILERPSISILAGGLVALLAPTCASEAPAPSSTVVVFEPGTGSLPAYGDVPFPSDLYREARHVSGAIQGLERVVPVNAPLIASALGEMDGFGRATPIVFFTRGAVDAASLGAEGAVVLVDVDQTSPQQGTRLPVTARYLPSLSAISVLPEPGIVLAPGRRYAAIVTSRVKAADGRTLEADTALRNIESSGASQEGTAGTLYGGALAALEKSGAISSRQEVVGMAVFTTSNIVFELARLRERIRDELPPPELHLDEAGAAPYHAAVFGVGTTPNLDDWLGTPEKDETGKEWPGGDNPGGPAHDQISVVASGTMRATAFASPDTHHIEHDENGEALVADTAASVPFTLVLPNAPPPTSAGYPVVIYGHGLAGNRSNMFAAANELARAGFAVVGIDAVAHGLRAGIPDEKNDFPGSFVGRDGLPDRQGLPLDFLGGLTDAVAVRDNFRQTILDLISVVRMVEDPALDLSALDAARCEGAGGCGPTPKLDPTHIYYNGISLGGMMGSILAATEPDLRAASLEVPGAALLELIAPNSSLAHGLIETLLVGSFAIPSDEPLDAYHPALALMAMATEGGDPIEYVPHVFGPSLFDPAPPRRPSVLVSYSIDDELMANVSTHALIRALGIPLVTPSIRDVPGAPQMKGPVAGNMGGATGAAVQYSPSTHGLGYGRHDVRAFMPGDPQIGADDPWPTIPAKITVELPIREHFAAVVHFFQTDLAGGAAEAIVTAPPVDDYDGDGVPDAADAAPFDPMVQ